MPPLWRQHREIASCAPAKKPRPTRSIQSAPSPKRVACSRRQTRVGAGRRTASRKGSGPKTTASARWPSRKKRSLVPRYLDICRSRKRKCPQRIDKDNAGRSAEEGQCRRYLRAHRGRSHGGRQEEPSVTRVVAEAERTKTSGRIMCPSASPKKIGESTSRRRNAGKARNATMRAEELTPGRCQAQGAERDAESKKREPKAVEAIPRPALPPPRSRCHRAARLAAFEAEASGRKRRPCRRARAPGRCRRHPQCRQSDAQSSEARSKRRSRRCAPSTKPNPRARKSSPCRSHVRTADCRSHLTSRAMADAQ